MSQVMRVLSSLISIYMMILFFRIILTWFSWLGQGALYNMLARITDPYLNWFRRFPLRVGFLDLSPIAAIAVLSLVNRVFAILASTGTITVGLILALVLQMLWGAVSFLLGFLIIVFVLRFIAHLARFNIYNPFWRIVDAIHQPVSYKINRVLFKDRIITFTNSCLVSIAGLAAAYVILRLLVVFISRALLRLPV